MEALVAASISALTIYDMVKGLDKGMEIRRLSCSARVAARAGSTGG